ncbi:hypothetical protein BC936DRAFT_144324, partial [Jimgerdemannia flammicorona]
MYLNDVNVLNTRSTPFQWTGGFTPSPTSGSTPSPTGGSTPSLTGGFAPNPTSTDYISIIICCGNSGARYFNDVAVLNTQTWSWTQPNITGTAPMARSDHSSVMVNGQMIMFFGYNEPSAMYLNDVNVLNTRSTPFQWTGGFTPSPTSGSTPS